MDYASDQPTMLSAKQSETEIRQHINTKYGLMDVDRQMFRPHWQEIQMYVLPDNGVGLQGQQNEWEQIYGGKTHEKIIDGSATRYIDIFAAGMQSGLTTPSRPWFKLSLDDPELSAFPPVRAWLDEIERRMYAVMDASNFYGSLHHIYRELPTFGTAGQMIMENFDTIIRCRPFTIGEYWLSLNSDLEVDTFYRHCWMHACQLVEQFGINKVSDAAKQAYETNNVKALFQVIHAVEPNPGRTNLNDKAQKEWRSVYMQWGGGGGGVNTSGGYPDNANGLLSVSGFHEFPAQFPRWHVIGSKVYGRSRGMDALADVKMLQRFKEAVLVNYDKALEPPVVAPAELKNEQINTIPSGVNYASDMAGANSFRALYAVPNMLAEGMKGIDAIKGDLREWFFTDLFLMLANQPTRSNVTATEINERHEEKLLVLGPVLERVHTELLDPSISRIYSIMRRMGALPPTPPLRELRGRNIKIEYVSALAVAAKMSALTGMDQFISRIGGVAQMNPAVLDNINFDAYARAYAEDANIPAKLLNDPETIAHIRQARDQQQQQQQKMQAIAQSAETAKTASGADLGGGNNVLKQALAGLAGSGQPAQ